MCGVVCVSGAMFHGAVCVCGGTGLAADFVFVCGRRAEFRPLFRERDIAAGRLTVLVVSQRTDQDMAAWSEQVDAERLELASQVSREGAGEREHGPRDRHGMPSYFIFVVAARVGACRPGEECKLSYYYMLRYPFNISASVHNFRIIHCFYRTLTSRFIW